jgi:hypothetical protein
MARQSRLRGDIITISVAAAFMVPGCGDGKPSTDTSLNEATVTGKVLVKGVPAAGGTIYFNPSNSGRIVPARTAEINSDGSYTVKTYTGDNQVTFGGDVAKTNIGVGLLREYASVQSGSNEIDFDLMGPGGGKQGAIDLAKKSAQRGFQRKNR